MPAVGAQTVFSARIEKGYRLWGSDTSPDFTPAESGLRVDLEPRQGLPRQGRSIRGAGPDDVSSRCGSTIAAAVVYGWEPVLQNGQVIGRIAGGEYGYSVGAFIAHAVVDAEHTATGTDVTVHRTGAPHRATIVRGPLFDPRSERLTA